MLKVYLNELRKVKRQKTVRMIMLVGVLMICNGAIDKNCGTVEKKICCTAEHFRYQLRLNMGANYEK